MQNSTRSQVIILFTALYAAQGLPYGFFTQALPLVMRQAGLSLTQIGIASWLFLPWALKFLWAPYLEHYGTPRNWLLGLQAAAVVAAIGLGLLEPQQGLVALAVAAFVFSLLAATQDVPTDALAIRTLPAQDFGIGNGVQVGAYRLGMIIGSGPLLLVFDATNWITMFLCLAVLLALTMLPVLSLPSQKPSVLARQRNASDVALLPLRRLAMPGVLWFVALIFCYRLGDGLISNLLIPFMVDQQLTTKDIALMKGTVGSLTTVFGALAGGWLSMQMQRRTLLLGAGLAQALTFVPYLLAAIGLGGRELLWIATLAEGFIGTIATVALFTLMMDASDPEHAGTDYTLYACVVVVVSIISSSLGGVLGDLLGYARLFLLAILLSVAGCLVLVRQVDRRPAALRLGRAWTFAPLKAAAH